jgi:hypothetical protein
LANAAQSGPVSASVEIDPERYHAKWKPVRRPITRPAEELDRDRAPSLF